MASAPPPTPAPAVRPQAGGPPRVALVTRGDLFPTNHGAAVRIVRTAEYLSLLGAPVCVITDDKDAYWRFVDGVPERVPYGARVRAALEWPGVRQAPGLADRVCRRLGYPDEELFLYRAQFDPSWWARVLWVGRHERIQVFQAEFPGYGVPCALAARALGGRSSIVQHNVEWDRLQDVLGLSAQELRAVRALELAALRLVDEVLAVSADDRARMEAAGVPPHKITVIPHGVDRVAWDRPAARMRLGLGLPPDAPVLVFHGTLHYWPNTQAVRFLAEALLPRVLPVHPEEQVLH